MSNVGGYLPQSLPAGGTTGQVLTGALSWADAPAAGPFPPYSSGGWYTAGFYPSTSVVTSPGWSAGRAYLCPVLLGTTLTIDAVGYTGAGAGAAVTINGAIYSCDMTTGLPANLLGTPGALTIAAGDSTAVVRTVPVGPVTVPAGWCYLAIGNPAAAGTLQVTDVGSLRMPYGVGSINAGPLSAGVPSTLLTNASRGCISSTMGTAMPAVSDATATNSTVPVLTFRVH